MVDRHSKVAGEATGASFTFTLASRAASAFGTFVWAAAFEIPHSESLSQLSYSAYVKMV